nr:MAG TPA: type III secretion system protein SpaP [Bacteriophage sp.]
MTLNGVALLLSMFVMMPVGKEIYYNSQNENLSFGNESNLLIVFYVQIMPDDFVMQLHRF